MDYVLSSLILLALLALVSTLAIQNTLLSSPVMPKKFSVIQAVEIRPPMKSYLFDPKKLATRANGGHRGTVSFRSDSGGGAVFPIQIGTPPQELPVTFDTGSYNNWLLSTNIEEDQRQGLQVYDPALSTTFSEFPKRTFSIEYADESSASGNYGMDSIVLGSLPPLQIAIGLANDVSLSLKQEAETTGAMGVLGLMHSPQHSINQSQPRDSKSFFEIIKPSLSQPLFATDFHSDALNTLDFGAIDVSKYSGAISYADVITNDGTWTVAVSSTFHFGDKALRTSIRGCMIDTGSYAIQVSPDFASKYYKDVKGAHRHPTYQSLWTFPPASTLPDFSVEIDGVVHTVPGRLLDLGPLISGGKSRRCHGGIQAGLDRVDVVVLGELFLQTRYVVFDGSDDRRRIGFAEKATRRDLGRNGDVIVEHQNIV